MLARGFWLSPATLFSCVACVSNDSAACGPPVFETAGFRVRFVHIDTTVVARCEDHGYRIVFSSAIMSLCDRGRTALLPFMNIVDLRQISVRQVEPLLEEEARHWRDELHWDYRSALDLIKRFLEAHALCGCAAFENGNAAGYSFYVLEEQKGLIGGLYVSAKYQQAVIGRRLLDEMLYSMRAVPQLTRIEAQLMPFGGPVEGPLRDLGFRLYTRQFMLFDLQKSSPARAGGSASMRLDRWNDRFFDPCAKLIYLCYTDHVDGEINDQYRSRGGALKFLKNIILLPGCGQFVPGASFVLRQPGSDELMAAVLTSEVASGVGHTTQICVLPGYQGHGLGRMLMQSSAEALRSMKFRELTLTVTSENRSAVQLYEKLGFTTIRSFTAGVWPR
jgi:ribosomal protein S18 acetylase RimI-like enzyme